MILSRFSRRKEIQDDADRTVKKMGRKLPRKIIKNGQSAENLSERPDHEK